MKMFDGSQFYRSENDIWLKRNRSDFAKKDDAKLLAEFTSRIAHKGLDNKVSIEKILDAGWALFDEKDFWTVVSYQSGKSESTAYFPTLNKAIAFIEQKLSFGG